MAELNQWVNDRLGIMPGLVYVVRRKIPADVNWLYTFGSAALFLFLVQALTGGTTRMCESGGHFAACS